MQTTPIVVERSMLDCRRPRGTLLRLCLLIAAPLAYGSDGATSCREEPVSLTHPRLIVHLPTGTIIDGRASVIVCATDVPKLSKPIRAALERELERVVEEEHFHMHLICTPGSEKGAKREVERMWAERRQAILRRFNAVSGGVAVRRIDCAFGWGESFD